VCRRKSFKSDFCNVALRLKLILQRHKESEWTGGVYEFLFWHHTQPFLLMLLCAPLHLLSASLSRTSKHFSHLCANDFCLPLGLEPSSGWIYFPSLHTDRVYRRVDGKGGKHFARKIIRLLIRIPSIHLSPPLFLCRCRVCFRFCT